MNRKCNVLQLFVCSKSIIIINIKINDWIGLDNMQNVVQFLLAIFGENPFLENEEL